MAAPERDLDLVVWGATGFTGSLAVAYLLGDPNAQLRSFACAGPAAPADLRWAVAGRNRAKLEALGAPMVIVTAADDRRLRHDARPRTRAEGAGDLGHQRAHLGSARAGTCGHGRQS